MFRIYCDIESTGFDWLRNDICSIAMIVTDDSLNIKSEFYETVKPDFNKFYSEDAEKIHGFSKSELATFQNPKNLCRNILNFLKEFKSDYPQLFISHALRQFDYRFIEGLFRKQNMQYDLWKIIRQDYQRSTIEEARKAKFTDNKLNAWARFLDINLDHHNALSDTRACYEVDKYLLGETWQQVTQKNSKLTLQI